MNRKFDKETRRFQLEKLKSIMNPDHINYLNENGKEDIRNLYRFLERSFDSERRNYWSEYPVACGLLDEALDSGDHDHEDFISKLSRLGEIAGHMMRELKPLPYTYAELKLARLEEDRERFMREYKMYGFSEEDVAFAEKYFEYTERHIKATSDEKKDQQPSWMVDIVKLGKRVDQFQRGMQHAEEGIADFNEKGGL